MLSYFFHVHKLFFETASTIFIFFYNVFIGHILCYTEQMWMVSFYNLTLMVSHLSQTLYYFLLLLKDYVFWSLNTTKNDHTKYSIQKLPFRKHYAKNDITIIVYILILLNGVCILLPNLRILYLCIYFSVIYHG